MSSMQTPGPAISASTLPSNSGRPFLGRLAWLLAVGAMIGALVAVAGGARYAIVTGDTSQILSHLALTPFITIVYAIVGALVAARHSRNPIGWIFLTTALFYALTAFAVVYQDYAPALTTVGSLPAARLATWLDLWLWIPAVFLPTIFVFLLFPDGRLLSPRWRIVFWSAAAGLVMAILSVALHPGPLESWGSGVNPYGSQRWAGTLELLAQISSTLVGFGFLTSLANFILRFRRSRALERAQMKWLLYSLVFVLLGLLASALLWSAGAENELAAELAMAIFNLTILGVAVAAAIAILRYRLYDIDLVFNRTLVYAALTTGIVVVYVLVVGGVGALLQVEGSPLLALLSTGLVAVLFQPSRDRLQRGVDRLFYGERDAPLDALSRLGSRLEAAISPEMVLPTVVETIAQTLKLPYVAISLQTGEEDRIVAQYGAAPEWDAAEKEDVTIRLPLVYQGEKVGQLIAGPRAPGEPFGEPDLRLLENIAHQAGPAVHAVRLTAALQHSRLQLVTAREEERRRLRRDLHDGLGATLAGLLLETGALRRAIRNDPDKAEALVDEFRRDIRATIDDIRRLVYALRPPTLDQLGLVAAVRAQAAQWNRPASQGAGEQESPGLQVKVEAPEELPPLPAAVEVAAYRIVQEALANVVHHARARNCLVRLELDDTLELEILDDGVGITKAGPRDGGLGLLSMRERALELGGTCRIEPGPGGGTRVVAFLPLPPETETDPT